MAMYHTTPKSASPDYWAFLEKIDAPQWVDLSLEGACNADQGDDGWFETVHPFHLQSFHELVSPSPHGVQKKGKVSNSVRLYPDLVNSVSKSRGGKPFPRNKVSASACLKISTKGNKLENPIHVQVRSSTVCNPCKANRLTNVRDIQGKSSTADPENQSSTACLEISRKENEFGYSIDIQTKSSAAGDNNNQSNKACLQVPSKENESKNLLDLPTVADINNLSMSTEFRSVVPRASGLITMLKAASLRRSCGVLPMRVEVKDEQQPKDRKSSNKISVGSSHDTNRKTSSLGSTSNNSQQVKKKETLKKLKNQTEKSTMPSNKHNWNKSSIGSSTTLEERAKNRCRSSIDQNRKKASTGSSNFPEESSDTSMKYNKFGQALKEAGRKQGQPVGKDSGKLGRNHGQPIGGRKFGAELSMRGKTASRRPLKDVNNIGLSQHKSDILQNQRFPGKENNKLGTTLHQKINQTKTKKPLASLKETFADQVELKVHAQPKAESILHSIKDIKQWEKNSGRSYFSLSRMEKEKANRGIQICKS